MDLEHIALSDLKVSPVNVRHGRQAPDVSDILPSIRTRGVLQPLLVRRNGRGFEIVAGRRRYFAVKHIAEEAGTPPDEVALPCAIMGEKDDAAAMEASLIENVTHLPMDEMAQYEAFAKLLKQGRTVSDIAETFGVTELTVKRRLALANLTPKIRDAYRNGDIEPEDLKLLTLASKRQQQEWLARFEQESDTGNDEAEPAPRGSELKHWLFDGERIMATAALFSVENYKGVLITDLFDEMSYFADREAFWRLQNEAIARARDGLVAKGWGEVVVLERGQHFPVWQYTAVAQEDGGKVFIAVHESGEVEVHEGFLEATVQSRRRHKRDADDEGQATDDAAESEQTKVARPELTKAAENYLALHRHAIVRAELLRHPGVALRLAVVHMIVGSPLWAIKADTQRADRQEIADSIRVSAAQAAFDTERAAILALLELEPSYARTVTRPNSDPYQAAAVFARLLALADEDVHRIFAFVMGETLSVGAALVDAVGVVIKPDVARWWQADAVFLDLIRDRRAVNAMLAEVAGRAVADANVSETATVQKTIIRDCLNGAGRDKVEGWVPGYMAFPIRPYSENGSVRLAEQWQRIAALFPTA